MEPFSLVASSVAMIHFTGVCSKLSSKLVGPSSYKTERLQSLNRTLYGFNGTMRNLQTHLEIHEEDQTRLNTLEHLKEPLQRCEESLELLSERLQSDGFIAQHVLGTRFDKKFDLCLRVLDDAKGLLEMALQCDQT